ncbi:MAG: hypothetical protein ACF8GE_01180 [Phycisphaerales bacterium JB043]
MHLLTAITVSMVGLGGLTIGTHTSTLAPTTEASVALNAEAILGTWDCTADFGDGNKLPFSMLLEEDEGAIVGEVETGDGQEFVIWGGTYDEESGQFAAMIAEPGSDDGAAMSATFEEDEFEGEVETPEGVVTIAGSRG